MKFPDNGFSAKCQQQLFLLRWRNACLHMKNVMKKKILLFQFETSSLYMTWHNITLSIYDNICKQIQNKERYIMQTTRNRKRLLNLKFKYGMFRRIKRYHFVMPVHDCLMVCNSGRSFFFYINNSIYNYKNVLQLHYILFHKRSPIDLKNESW